MAAVTVNYAHSTPLAGVDLDATSTTQTFALGFQVKGASGTEWEYVRCNATTAVTAGDAVAIDEGNRITPLTKALADVGHQIGFAQVAFAVNEYGWVAVSGRSINCRLAAACAADVALFTTATAGVLDDLSTSQTKIQGVRSVDTITDAASSQVIANWPQIAETP